MTETRKDFEVGTKPTLPFLRVANPPHNPNQTALASTPPREVSPDPPAPSLVKQAHNETKPSIPRSIARFPARTERGEKQCTNCGETDTPQWRGTLCNTCALWKRSRGVDRPLPLLFPVRKRPRSVGPELEHGEGEGGKDGARGRGAKGVKGEPERDGCQGDRKLFWTKERGSALAAYERRMKGARRAGETVQYQ
jgi:hypothetical protein